MKRYSFILAIILAGIGLYGCGSKGMGPNELISSEKKHGAIEARILQGDQYAKTGEIEKACSSWKCACELGACSRYALSCLDDSSVDAEKFIDQDLLARIVVEDTSPYVRTAAARHLTDQTLLEKIAAESKDSNLRESAVKNLVNQGLLVKIAEEDEDIKIRIIAVNRLTDLVKADQDNDYPEKFSSADLLSRITDTTEGDPPVWKSSGTGAFKKAGKNKTGLKLTESIDKNPSVTNDSDKEKEDIIAVCGNDYCEKNESHSNCPADCFPEDIKPTGLSEGYKAVFLDFVYKGQKSGIYFVVNRGVHEKLASLPRLLSYKNEKEEIKKDFILPRLNNQLQKEKLLPLVEKVKSLTPDVNKQARIAISLVQNIPYGFPAFGESEINYEKKYPYGVIWEQTGICDEKSDLLLFLLRELGFGTATLIYKKEYHRAVGIKCPEAYDVGDTGYCYVEVTTPKIIMDNMSDFEGPKTLTDFTVINISDGIQLEGVEEEFTDKKLYYDLLNKAKANNKALEQDEYTLFNSLLNKYGIEKQ